MKQNKYLITGDDIATMGLTLLPGKTELSGNKALTRKDILDNYLVEIAGITDDNRLVTYERVSSSVYLNLNKNTLNFTAAGGSDTITIDTNLDDSQLSINTVSGFTVSRSGKTITVTANNLGTTVTEAKSSILTVSGQGLSYNCNISQEANIIESLSIRRVTTNYPIFDGNFSAVGESKNASCFGTYTSGNSKEQTNVAWSIVGTGFSWNPNPIYEYVATVIAESRGTIIGNSRTGTLTVTCAGKSTSITLTQEANSRNYYEADSFSNITLNIPTLTSSAQTKTISASANAYCYYTSGSKRFENAPLYIDISLVPWAFITRRTYGEPGLSTSNSTCTISVVANDSGLNRTADIIVYAMTTDGEPRLDDVVTTGILAQPRS